MMQNGITGRIIVLFLSGKPTRPLLFFCSLVVHKNAFASIRSAQSSVPHLSLEALDATKFFVARGSNVSER